MKKEVGMWVAVGLLALCMAISICQSSEPKECIRVAAWFALTPVRDSFVINTDFYFDSIEGPPINVSLQALKHLKNATIFIYRSPSMLGYEVSIILNTYGNVKTEEIREEFLRVFNYTSLSLVRSPTITPQNEIVEYRFDYGYLPFEARTMRDFLKFKPQTGFAMLLDDFVGPYTAENSTIGVMAYYHFVKNGLSYSWDLAVRSFLEEPLREWDFEKMQWVDLKRLGKKIVDLKSLLNTQKEIIASAESKISMEFQNRTDGKNKYAMIIESVSPGNFESYISPGVATFTWILKPGETLENIVVRMKVDITKIDSEQPLIAIIVTFPTKPLVLLSIIILILGATSVIYYKKRRMQKR